MRLAQRISDLMLCPVLGMEDGRLDVCRMVGDPSSSVRLPRQSNAVKLHLDRGRALAQENPDSRKSLIRLFQCKMFFSIDPAIDRQIIVRNKA